jgi:predicted RecA/RadA family phage recombinase
MAKNFVQPGATIDYVAGGTITSGQVVPLQHAVGIALGDATSGQSVAVAVEGVFTVPKVAAAVFAVGEKLIWDSSAAAFDDSAATPASGDLTGAAIAVVAGLNTETTCTVKLTPGNVTRT